MNQLQRKQALFDAITEYVEAKIQADTARFGISKESTLFGRLNKAEYELKEVLRNL